MTSNGLVTTSESESESAVFSSIAATSNNTAAVVDDWYIANSDDESLETIELTKEQILQYILELDQTGTLALQWKCPGRRPPTPTPLAPPSTPQTHQTQLVTPKKTNSSSLGSNKTTALNHSASVSPGQSSNNSNANNPTAATVAADVNTTTSRHKQSATTAEYDFTDAVVDSKNVNAQSTKSSLGSGASSVAHKRFGGGSTFGADKNKQQKNKMKMGLGSNCANQVIPPSSITVERVMNDMMRQEKEDTAASMSHMEINNMSPIKNESNCNGEQFSSGAATNQPTTSLSSSSAVFTSHSIDNLTKSTHSSSYNSNITFQSAADISNSGGEGGGGNNSAVNNHNNNSFAMSLGSIINTCNSNGDLNFYDSNNTNNSNNSRLSSQQLQNQLLNSSGSSNSGGNLSSGTGGVAFTSINALDGLTASIAAAAAANATHSNHNATISPPFSSIDSLNLNPHSSTALQMAAALQASTNLLHTSTGIDFASSNDVSAANSQLLQSSSTGNLSAPFSTSNPSVFHGHSNPFQIHPHLQSHTQNQSQQQQQQQHFFADTMTPNESAIFNSVLSSNDLLSNLPHFVSSASAAAVLENQRSTSSWNN